MKRARLIFHVAPLGAPVRAIRNFAPAGFPSRAPRRLHPRDKDLARHARNFARLTLRASFSLRLIFLFARA